MSFKDIYLIKREYRSFKDDIVGAFYIPILEESISYKRAVGYFTSSALTEISKGIHGLTKSNGKMKLIVSPVLTEDDISEIEKGYSLRKKVEESIIREVIKSEVDDSNHQKLSLLAYLISNKYLDIKVAYISNYKKMGMYHEKIGIVEDVEGNKIAFTGSLNETYSALKNNYESIDVFCSWRSEELERVSDKEIAFDSIWNNNENNLEVIEFPQVAKDKIIKHYKDLKSIQVELLENSQYCGEIQVEYDSVPELPNYVSLYDYQNKAIQNWVKQNYQGIFDMATGTGKTLTGLGAVVELYRNKKRLALIIVCPFQHLVEQWVEDIVKFNIKPVIGYSTSKQKDWRKRLEDEIIDYNLEVSSFLCFITTNSMFTTKFVQNVLSKINNNKMLLVDEAHNFGSPKLSSLLYESYIYRLALSATLERHHDDEGTSKLVSFFGNKCIEYDISRAIAENKLTQYYYYPIVIFLTDEEHEKYRNLSIKISKNCSCDNDGNIVLSEYAKMLLIERSRIIAGAKNKLKELKNVLMKHKNESHILVYCGATRVINDDGETVDEMGERQIVAVSKIIGNELEMATTHFTSNESQHEREQIKTRFENNDPFQVLVAIKCLDEGVNIPSIKIACILASSTNPKEYIQRRGRVLRKFPGKNEAIIYDFVTLPKEVDLFTFDENQSYDISLVKRELTRMKEFGDISKNPKDTDILIKTLIKQYNLDLIEEEKDEFGANY